MERRDGLSAQMSAVGTTTVAEGATSEPQHSVATGSVADGAGQTTTAVRAGTHAVESVASYISIEKLLRLMSELEHVLKRAGRMNECWDNNSAAGGGLSRRERWKNRVSRFHTNVLRQRHSASAVTVTVGGAGASVAFLSVCRTLLALIIELEAEVKYSCQHFRWRSRYEPSCARGDRPGHVLFLLSSLLRSGIDVHTMHAC